MDMLDIQLLFLLELGHYSFSLIKRLFGVSKSYIKIKKKIISNPIMNTNDEIKKIFYVIIIFCLFKIEQLNCIITKTCGKKFRKPFITQTLP